MLQGRVEICYGNTWFGICGELFNSYEKPKSICRLLGYSEKGQTLLLHCNIAYRL